MRVLVRKKLNHVKLNDILLKREACTAYGLQKERKLEAWTSPSPGVLKFNVDGATRRKLGHVGIGGALRNKKGVVLCMFSKHVEVMAILEACCREQYV